MKLSMYWISRNRISELTTSLLSFITNANDNNNIEYIVTVDSDDTTSITGLKNIHQILKTLYNVDLKILITNRYGYHGIYMYHNLIAENFTGDCMCTVNDDMFCISKNWDKELQLSITPYMNEPLLIFKKGINEAHKTWPTAHGINRKWLDIATGNQTNYAFMHPGMDVWLQRFANEFQLTIEEPNYDIIHIQKSDLRYESKRTKKEEAEYQEFSRHHMNAVKNNFLNWSK
jgi:hypothetical protein